MVDEITNREPTTSVMSVVDREGGGRRRIPIVGTEMVPDGRRRRR